MNTKSTLARIDYNAPFTLTFCLACIAVFAVATLTGGAILKTVFSVDAGSGFQNAISYPRLFLHVFGHANLEHLTSNLVFLLLLGPRLEESYGWTRLLIVSIITAVLTGMIMMVFFNGHLLGASGIVFAMIILSSFAKARSGSIPLTFILIALIFLGSELYHAFQGHTEIAHFAHIAGGIIGGISGFYMTRR